MVCNGSPASWRRGRNRSYIRVTAIVFKTNKTITTVNTDPGLRSGASNLKKGLHQWIIFCWCILLGHSLPTNYYLENICQTYSIDPKRSWLTLKRKHSFLQRCDNWELRVRSIDATIITVYDNEIITNFQMTQTPIITAASNQASEGMHRVSKTVQNYMYLVWSM